MFNGAAATFVWTETASPVWFLSESCCLLPVYREKAAYDQIFSQLTQVADHDKISAEFDMKCTGQESLTGPLNLQISFTSTKGLLKQTLN